MINRRQSPRDQMLKGVLAGLLLVMPMVVQAIDPDGLAFAAQADAVTFVGSVQGTDAFIAVVSDGQDVQAYLCDGVTYGDWFRGPVRDGRAEIESERGLRLAVQLRPGGASGTVRGLGGNEWAFEAEPAQGEAGLYRTRPDDPEYVGGWVVLNDGDFRGPAIGFGLRSTTPVTSSGTSTTTITTSAGQTVEIVKVSTSTESTSIVSPR